jgi:Flp pilus assembly protein TadG
VGIYIVSIAALFFLAFAYFAVGQAAVKRNGAQTAADAAALAAAREERDQGKDAFLAALSAGDLDAIGKLLGGDSGGGGCAGDIGSAASSLAGANDAEVTSCSVVAGPPGVTVSVRTLSAVGKSVIPATSTRHAVASATALIEPRCTIGGKQGHGIRFRCDGGPLTIDPTVNGFRLDLSQLYAIHLSK